MKVPETRTNRRSPFLWTCRLMPRISGDKDLLLRPQLVKLLRRGRELVAEGALQAALAQVRGTFEMPALANYLFLKASPLYGC